MKESAEPKSALINSSPKAGEAGDRHAGALVKRYKVTIAGESYFLVSDEPEERVKAVARLVDTKIQSLAHLGHTDDSKRVATLVALQYASTTQAFEERAEKLIAHITEVLSHFSL